MQMNRLKARLKHKKIDLQYTHEAVSFLATMGFDPNFGARPVKRVIQQMVENEVALGVLRGDFKEDDSILVDVDISPNVKERLAQSSRLIIKKIENGSRMDAMVAND